MAETYWDINGQPRRYGCLFLGTYFFVRVILSTFFLLFRGEEEFVPPSIRHMANTHWDVKIQPRKYRWALVISLFRGTTFPPSFFWSRVILHFFLIFSIGSLIGGFVISLFTGATFHLQFFDQGYFTFFFCSLSNTYTSSRQKHGFNGANISTMAICVNLDSVWIMKKSLDWTMP